jgi:hypothetical protein
VIDVFVTRGIRCAVVAKGKNGGNERLGHAR